MRTVFFVSLVAVLFGMTAVALAVQPPPPGGPVPPGSMHMPPGEYHMQFNPPLHDGAHHTLSVGGAPGNPLIDGQPAVPTNPPPGYEDAQGRMWYFYPDGTVLVMDPDGTWHAGTWTKVG